MIPLAALDLARRPGMLAASLLGCAAILIATGWLWSKCVDGSRKDG